MCPTPRLEQEQFPQPCSSAPDARPPIKVDFGMVMEPTDSGLLVERPVLYLTSYMGLHKKVYKSCTFMDDGKPVPSTLLKPESRPSTRAEPTEVPACKEEEEDPSLAQPPSTSLPSTLPAARSTVPADAPTQAHSARRQLTFSADVTSTANTASTCGLAAFTAKPSKLPRAPAHTASSQASSPPAGSPTFPQIPSAAAKPATRSPGYMAATASSAAKARPAVKRASGSSSSSSSASSTAATPHKSSPTKSASPSVATPPAPRAQLPSPSTSKAPEHAQGACEQAPPGHWHAKTGGVWIPRLNLAPVHAALAQAQAVH